jgi:Uma2 family endonuclease
MDVAGLMYASMMTYVAEHNLGHVTIEVAFVLDADDRTDWVHDARQPDVAFVSREKADTHDQQYGKEGPWRLVPDVIVEVVSPNDVYSEVLEKVTMYLRYGVKMAIIADPKTRTMRVHTQENPGGVQLGDTDTLSAEPVIPGWSIPLAKVFGTKS